MKTLTASEANRQFSRVLREVSQGETFTVVSRGKPVATITSADVGGDRCRAAKSRLLKRLRQQRPTGKRDWQRSDLYAG